MLQNPKSASDLSGEFSYSDYEKLVRTKDSATIELHRQHLSHFVQYFQGCERVLDLACGQGIFLDLLRDAGIPSLGVEGDAAVVRLAEAKGHRIVEQGVIEFLNETSDRFDGIFCSHLIEHLPFDVLLRLIQGVSNCVLPDGKFVLAFPNPRALRTHLLQFWFDPQHVRFYDSQLVKGVLEFYHFEVISDSDNPLAGDLRYRVAPKELTRRVEDIGTRLEQRKKSNWLTTQSAQQSSWAAGVSYCAYWVRKQLGILALSQEIESILFEFHDTLAAVIELLDGYDMEVRLVARKIGNNK